MCLTLDPKVIATGFANDGQDVPADGQVPSLTSTNNFINFCLTVPNLPITNGKQITTGSCNPAPIGVIPSTDNMPSSKFSFPKNFGAVKANTAFTIEMQIKNMQTGFFVNAQENYFAAPQFLNAQGQIQGHSHVVIEELTAVDQTTTTDPKKFAFFKGLNAAAAGGKLTADVTAGLPAGVYKLSSINSAANHQPVIVPVAQHGSLDDAVYFFVTADGNPPPNAPFSNNGGAAASSSVAATSTAAASASASASVPASAAASVTASATGKGGAAASASATGKGGAAASASVPVKGGAAAPTATGKGAIKPTAAAASSAAAPAASATGKTAAGGAGAGAGTGATKGQTTDKNGTNGKDGATDGKTGAVDNKNGGNAGADTKGATGAAANKGDTKDAATPQSGKGAQNNAEAGSQGKN